MVKYQMKVLNLKRCKMVNLRGKCKTGDCRNGETSHEIESKN